MQCRYTPGGPGIDGMLHCHSTSWCTTVCLASILRHTGKYAVRARERRHFEHNLTSQPFYTVGLQCSCREKTAKQVRQGTLTGANATLTHPFLWGEYRNSPSLISDLRYSLIFIVSYK